MNPKKEHFKTLLFNLFSSNESGERLSRNAHLTVLMCNIGDVGSSTYYGSHLWKSLGMRSMDFLQPTPTIDNCIAYHNTHWCDKHSFLLFVFLKKALIL